MYTYIIQIVDQSVSILNPMMRFTDQFRTAGVADLGKTPSLQQNNQSGEVFRSFSFNKCRNIVEMCVFYVCFFNIFIVS